MASRKKGNSEKGETNGLENEYIEIPESCFGIRHIQAVLLFFMFGIAYGMRINLSVGIVAMTDETVNPDVVSYDWTIGMKSNILSAFFWGYVLPQIIAGRLAEMYGPKWFLTVMMIITSAFTALIPYMASLSPWAVVVCRIFQGASQAFFLPSIQYMLSKWAPISERSRTSSFIYSGGPLGTVICMPVTGWISASRAGWPWAFYMYSVIGFIWTAAWVYWGSNSPAAHKSISEVERNYIQKTCGSGAATTSKETKTPLIHMAKSLPAWSILVAFCGQNWGYWTLLTEIPTYMSGVLDYDIKANGLLSAAPYFSLWVFSFGFSAMADFFVNRKILSLATTRKIMTAIAFLGGALALLILGLITEASRASSISLLILAVSVNGAVYSGFQVNHIDICPSHAGTLMGITSGTSNIFSIVAPLIVPYIVTDESDPTQWRIIFFIAAAIYVAADIFFTIFGRAEVQYWDKLDDHETKDTNKSKSVNNEKA